MRTITFAVEVDDKIFDTMVPSIYDDAVKDAPDGRLFLCKDKTSAKNKLVRLHRDVMVEGDKEAPWFENLFLPDKSRIVGMSGGNAAEYVDSKSKMVEEIEAEQQEDLVYKKLDEIFRELHSLGCGVKLLGEVHNNAHEAVLAHFKQSHEHENWLHENWLHEHQNHAEDRLMKHIQECCDKATLTTKTYCHDILHALPELEDRIKEYIGEPDPAQPAVSDDITPQALLKAFEIVSRTIWSSVKSE